MVAYLCLTVSRDGVNGVNCHSFNVDTFAIARLDEVHEKVDKLVIVLRKLTLNVQHNAD